MRTTKSLLFSFILALSFVLTLQAQSMSDLKFEPVSPQNNPVSKDVSDRGTNTIHVVVSKQTLYAISKIHNVSVEEIKKVNNLTSNNILIGQELIIPGTAQRSLNEADTPTNVSTPAPVISAPVANVEPPQNSGSPTMRVEASPAVVTTRSEQGTTMIPRWSYHMVTAGDDLSSIASDYGIEVEQLQSWNDDITADKMNIGDRLKVKLEYIPFQPSPEVRKETPAPVVAQRKIEEAPNQSSASPAVTTEVPTVTTEQATPTAEVKRTATPEAVTPTNPSTEALVEPFVELGKNIESGTYIGVSAPHESAKYYAYHKSLPIGSFVKLMIPNNSGYIDVKITNRIRADRAEILGLSPDCVRIIGKNAKQVTIRY